MQQQVKVVHVAQVVAQPICQIVTNLGHDPGVDHHLGDNASPFDNRLLRVQVDQGEGLVEQALELAHLAFEGMFRHDMFGVQMFSQPIVALKVIYTPNQIIF